MRLTSGDRIGPYNVQALLGAGGMGEVYVAHDPRLQRTVAIKVLTSTIDDPDARSRMQREAQAVAALDHPHICTVFDVGHERGLDYLVMALVEGETLAARLRGGALPIADALEVAIQAADGLEAAHRRGIVHCDVKPANIMLTGRGVKLLDFGVAVPTQDALSTVTTMQARAERGDSFAGTVAYAAPEALQGRTDPRSDVFSLGAVLFEMIAGRRAFEGESAWHVAAALVHETPPAVSTLRRGIPVQLDRAVQRALAKDPAARWQSMTELRAQLEACRDSLSGAPARAPEPDPEPAATIPRPWPLTAMIGINALFAAVFVYPTMLIALIDPSPIAVPLFALAMLCVLAGVGLFLQRAWGRRIEQGLAALALLVFPFGTVLGTAALSYLHRSGLRLLLSGKQAHEFTPAERDAIARDVPVARKWMYALPALALATTVPLAVIAAITIPSMLRARIAANEAMAVGHLRSIQTAERELSRFNDGLFVEARCLTEPQRCVPSWVGGALLTDSWQVFRGYRFDFYPGPAASPERDRQGRSATPSLASYAVAAVPIEPGRTGRLLFCADSSGKLCKSGGPRQPPPQVVDGRCTSCSDIK